MIQKIYIEKAGLEKFKERIKDSNVTSTLMQESHGNYTGFIEGGQTELMEFAYQCGKNKLFIVFLYP